MFKVAYVLKILRKYVIFLTLFKVNLNYNNLLKFFLVIIKSLFKRLIIKLKIYKYVINVILMNLFNKYSILIALLFLYYAKYSVSGVTPVSGYLICKVIEALGLNDTRLYI